jgi:hypothetical protein
VPTRRGEHAKAPGVAPTTERRGRHTKELARFGEADPIGIARRWAGHETYANLPEVSDSLSLTYGSAGCCAVAGLLRRASCSRFSDRSDTSIAIVSPQPLTVP